MTPLHAGAFAPIRSAAGALMLALVSIGLVAAGSSAAQAEARISGLAFGDYYYNVQGSSITEDENAFRINRILFTTDSDIDETFSARFTLEADGASTVNGSGKLAVFVKEAYLGWGDFLPGGELSLGMVRTSAFANTEMVWGYRAVEKTALDLLGFASPTDIGVTLAGTFADGPLGYHLSVVNGNAQRPENDLGKRIYATLPLRGGHQWILEPLFDANLVPGNRDQLQFRLLGGWTPAEGAIGAEVAYRRNLNAGTGGDDVVPLVLSAFGRWNASDKLTTLGRVDWYDPNTADEDLGYVQELFIAGIDYHPVANVHFIPNLELTAYHVKDASTPERDADVMAKVTFLYTYR